LDSEERALVRGLIVNKFRGDLNLFSDGVHILEQRSGVPVLGVVPYLPDLAVPEEDAVALDQSPAGPLEPAAEVEIAIVHLPHIANFDDFDPLAAEPGVRVRYVSSRRELGQPQTVILPGTKSTVADLAWMRARGLAQAIEELAAQGKAVVGICGGYQMLGRVIRDPGHVESPADEVPGLGLLPVETAFTEGKTTHRVRAEVLGGPGWLADMAGLVICGYEIHMGRTCGGDAWLVLTERSGAPAKAADGAASMDGKVWGCYLHGLFDNEAFRRTWLKSLGWRGAETEAQPTQRLEAALDRLADAVEETLDMERLERIVWES